MSGGRDQLIVTSRRGILADRSPTPWRAGSE